MRERQKEENCVGDMAFESYKLKNVNCSHSVDVLTQWIELVE